jgi:hypothetical protein
VRRCYDVAKPHVEHLLACDRRKNALIKPGNTRERIETRLALRNAFRY